MKDNKERILTLSDLCKLQDSMNKNNLEYGYIDNKANLFVFQCERAKHKITLQQVEEAIEILENNNQC